jgi:hypothetical protein
MEELVDLGREFQRNGAIRRQLDELTEKEKNNQGLSEEDKKKREWLKNDLEVSEESLTRLREIIKNNNESGLI